jgi:hypothetical protein
MNGAKKIGTRNGTTARFYIGGMMTAMTTLTVSIDILCDLLCRWAPQ